MNLHLHRGDREAKCRWFNPPALCLGSSSLVLIKDPRSHIISCFSLHEDKKQSYLLSVTIIAVFKRVYFKNIRMNEIPSSSPETSSKVMRQVQLEETTVKLCAVAPAPGLQVALKSRTTLNIEKEA